MLFGAWGRKIGYENIPEPVRACYPHLTQRSSGKGNSVEALVQLLYRLTQVFFYDPFRRLEWKAGDIVLQHHQLLDVFFRYHINPVNGRRIIATCVLR